MRGRAVWIDGFNVLTTVEAALGGAVVLIGRDGSLRDIAGVHGTYRRVEETTPAIALVGAALDRLGVGPCRWLLDRPVSNSGRLRAMLLDAAADAGRDWAVELPFDPDAELIASPRRSPSPRPTPGSSTAAAPGSPWPAGSSRRASPAQGSSTSPPRHPLPVGQASACLRDSEDGRPKPARRGGRPIATVASPPAAR